MTRSDRPANTPSEGEMAIDPMLPIIDPHRDLWPESPVFGRYMLAELLEDVSTQNIVATVYIECGAHYRDAGPGLLDPLQSRDVRRDGA